MLLYKKLLLMTFGTSLVFRSGAATFEFLVAYVYGSFINLLSSY